VWRGAGGPDHGTQRRGDAGGPPFGPKKTDLAWTSRASLLKLSSVGANDPPRNHWVRRSVGIAHANMPLEYREEIALDHFLRAIGGNDVGAMLTVWRPENLQKAADTAACWEAARASFGGAGRQPERRLEGLGGMR